jgi:hypothetical protein
MGAVYSLGTAAYLELGENLAVIPLNCDPAQIKLASNFSIRKPIGEKVQYFHFSFREI